MPSENELRTYIVKGDSYFSVVVASSVEDALTLSAHNPADNLDGLGWEEWGLAREEMEVREVDISTSSFIDGHPLGYYA